MASTGIGTVCRRMNIADTGFAESSRGGCVAIGNFDGVHRGHLRMLTALLELARSRRTAAVVVTFHPHPIAILRPDQAPPLLTTIPDRCRLLQAAGVDQVVVLPVTPQWLAMTPAEFFEEFLVGQLRVSGLVEGRNFRFGRDRRGTISDLAAMCRQREIPLRVVDLVADQAQEISSSRIRQLISAGRLAAAVELLGHPFRMAGIVREGARRGTQLGFPTANLAEIQTLLPAHGVYAGVAEVAGQSCVAAVSVGPNPTFQDQATKVECHLVDFQGSLYDRELVVDLLAEVRGLRTFSGPAELVQQIREDVVRCRQLVAARQGSG